LDKWEVEEVAGVAEKRENKINQDKRNFLGIFDIFSSATYNL